ncbi:MAG: DNA/RNA nuclease SfsA [Candidatus Wallacebacter cryptica]
MIRLPLGDLVEAYFVQRLNRFVIQCRLDKNSPETVEAHLADPGRLRELLVPDSRIWLRPSANPKRKTKWSAVLVEADNHSVVSLVSTLPNELIKTALKQKAIEELAAWTFVRSEYPVGRHRFDFLLEQDDQLLLLEVKSVTLVENGRGMFPDAVTLRGRKHLETLAELTASGKYQTAVLFVLQRSDADYITAASHIDPAFAQAMTEASETGVKLLGRRCTVTTGHITLGSSLPIVLHRQGAD